MEKRHPNTIKRIVAAGLAALAVGSHGATDLATAPLVTSSTSSVRPNIQFILDDSGSMAWDYLPDWADDNVNGAAVPGFLRRNSAYNGVYYDPETTYSPPVYYNADGTLNATTYPSMTGQSTATGGDSSASSGSRNWKAVKDDGYSATSATSNLTSSAYYWLTIPGEYCDTSSLKTCTTTVTAYPASLRWCNSSALTNCQASWIKGSYVYPRMPSPATATISFSGTTSTAITSVKVNNQEILSGTTTASTTSSTVASRVAANINSCTYGLTGNCAVAGYSATSSGSTVTLTAPANVTYTPVVLPASGIMTVTAGAFGNNNPLYAGTSVPGSILLTVIHPGNNSYPYPGTAAKHTKRTDCAGTTCTYQEEMTNFANWWAYYHTRIQMMKTATSAAFAPIGSTYRVGFFTIGTSATSTGTDFLDIGDFDATQKYNWYNKLFAARTPSYTPLRAALSKAGRIYAGKVGTDPVQYSCQQNFTILSTDGYWNSSAGYKVDGSTAVSNQDGTEPRPYNDGALVTYNKSTSQLQQSQTQLVQGTSQLQSRTTQIQSSTSSLQKQISQLQGRTSNLQSQTSQLQGQTSTLQVLTGQLQTRTSSNSGSTWTAWSNTTSCTWDNSSSSRRQCQYVWGAGVDAPSCTVSYSTGTSGTWSGNGTNCQYTAWSAAVGMASCSNVAQSTGPSYTVVTARQCNTVVTAAYANASSCTATTAPDASGFTTQCQYSSWNAWAGAGSCTALAPSSGPNYTVTTAKQCQTAVTTPYANASSCTETTIPDSGGNTTQCQYTSWTSWANASSCSGSAQSTSPNFTAGTATQCQTLYNNQTTDNGWVGAASCTPSSSGGQTITCQTVATAPTPLASCSCTIAAGSSSCTTAAAAGNSYTQTTCTRNTIAAATGVASCTADPPTAANSYISTNCNTATTNTSSSTCAAATALSANNYTTTTCAVASTSGGTSNTLADVAEYYYTTDLRTSTLGNCTGAVVAPATTGNDVCSNDVPNSGQDAASWQHMTTFTLGLGASGYMQFSPSYATATSGDYFDVKSGTLANPSGGICSWQSNGTACTWPDPDAGGSYSLGNEPISRIDDLWHAAVNGRGAYFSATSPASLAAGLGNALAGVSSRLGASAAATTSNPNVTSGDNFVFSSTFTTQEWSGQLFRQQIDLTTGMVPTFDLGNTATYDWAAQGLLDANGSRTLHTFDSASATKLKTFTWASLSADEQAYFNTANISTLSQFCASGVTCLSPADQTAAAGANLVAFLRGDRTNEGVATDTTKYYRQRAHVLGDIVNGEAVYVKGSLFEYADAGYSAFKTTNASRQGMVYAASNDGMLHAFNASSGAEVWSYVPSLVLPNLYKLADKNYAAQHQYFVDGTPVAGDVYFGGVWHTILVGGMNRGGRGYYALDITDPTSPKALWEYSETNMGYTYGNPEITKLADGTWVVLVTSGYNNIAPGDGVGRLYVLRADTGALIRTISTGVGDTTNPSGLARIRAWVDNAMSDNTASRVYGGDMLGNLWRFDINDTFGAAGYDAQLLTTFYSNAAGTTRQPITAKPELGEISGNAVIFVGTGRYLGTSDLTDTSQQSFYAVKDTLGATTLTQPRASGSGFVHQTLTTGTCPAGTPTTICTTGQSMRMGSSNAVNFATDHGWYIDLPDSGERSNTDPTLALGTIGFTTNVPNVSACTAGGYSYRYMLDYRTGAPVSTSTTGVVGVKLGNALATRGVFVRLPNNTIVQLTRMSDGTTLTTNVPIGAGSGTTRRVSWRELVGE